MTLHAHHLELLAPARTADIGIEAINHGADAVYIGGPAFGARATAGNAIADIERLVKHAHRYHARIFITLNTILRDDELEGARRMAWQVYEAGADALIVQDMGLLQLDLPPIQLHASTQTDIRTPEKARFLQDAGFSQIVPARELTLAQITAIRAAIDPQRTTIEFFVHGALCVAYSGQCFISHAHTGRSANRGDCSQACRLPYQVQDDQGRFIAYDKHVLSMKDNNQSANLGALVDAGVRSFKIEGRYKDMGYVKNITAHYRQLLDRVIEERESSDSPLARASSGSTRHFFTPDPNQNFNREFTDYFVNGRQQDIGAFDTPKNPGQAIGWVTQVPKAALQARPGARPQAADNWLELQLSDPGMQLHNGDGLCYYDLQKELVGLAINRAEPAPGGQPGLWRIWPKDAIAGLKDLRRNTEINRNRDMDWQRTMERPSSERRIGLWAELSEPRPGELLLQLTDEDGHSGSATTTHTQQLAKEPAQAEAALARQLDRFGGSIFHAHAVQVRIRHPWFVPAAQLNALRREALDSLEAARAAACQRPPRARPVEPPAPFPEDTLSYLANVLNHQAHDFYVKHGVKVIDAAYEADEELGEVSLMITKHCVRFSMSLCPKQAKGVIGVKGTIKAEPLHLINGKEKLTLRFDCKPCEMHVVGKIKPGVLAQQRRAVEASLAEGVPMRFYRTRPASPR
ncbi:U32 family peptidase [Corticibacter populi]|uniref:U32 family peptidase n=1 Tax=Corticibacter populi TaxID=1550736 RepID=A0A3M6QRS6_9BURK|nr:U32 family peptidase [Corticibacter populi]RMX05744.1 U32 family peptidase [Corticibacter populi]RZS30956.1 putative protease [Corticibacter populi]